MASLTQELDQAWAALQLAQDALATARVAQGKAASAQTATSESAQRMLTSFLAEMQAGLEALTGDTAGGARALRRLSADPLTMLTAALLEEKATTERASTALALVGQRHTEAGQAAQRVRDVFSSVRVATDEILGPATVR